jgi:small subunit ribosomal protein S24e
VNHRKHIKTSDYDPSFSQGEKQIYAYAEKRQNLTVAGQTPQMYLINTTRLDPMTYLLFGADAIQVTERGLECDEWLPIVGNLDALDDIQRLKALMESCMLRVFEGIHMKKSRTGPLRLGTPAREEDEAGEEMLNEDLSLSPREISDLDMVTRDIVRILNRYSDERMVSQSTTSSRNATPTASPAFSTSRLPGSRSGYSTPYGIGSAYNSRPGTPSRLSRSFHS